MTNEQTIWTFLVSRLNNPYGAAAVMGNFFIESGLDSQRLQSSYARKLDMTGLEYTYRTDNGIYPSDSFIHDKAGYGLAQWTYWTRKLSLYDYANEMATSVGDLDMQLKFFWDEIQLYKTAFNALKNATNVKEASDTFALRYEKPSDTSATALKRRSDKAQEFYDKYNSISGEGVRITADGVNLRVGNGKQFSMVARAKKGDVYPFVATAENKWNAIEYGNRVLWVHPDFSEVTKQ